jgi:NADPH:quinone reductase
MRAISTATHGGPEILKMIELQEPEPGAGEVTIDVEYAGVGFVDVLFRKGAFTLLPPPVTRGIEVSGRVRAVGSGVSRLTAGTPVAALLNDFVNLPGCGGYAEIARVRAALTIPLMPHTDPAVAAAALVNGTTAWIAVNNMARLRPGESVFVPGATGGLAGLIGQLADKLGAAPVIGTVSVADKRAAAFRLGYDSVLVGELSSDSLCEVFGPRGIDAVFDKVGGATRQLAFQHLAPLGRMVILGNASGRDTALPCDEFWHGSKTVIGLSLGGPAHAAPDMVAAAARELLQYVDHSEITAEPALVLPLAQASEAHRLIEWRTIIGKIVLDVR